MRNIAYRRVSTGVQDLKRQLFECNIEFDLEFSDKLSGKNTQRPSLQKMMGELQEGDTIHVHSIDRLARSLQDLQNLIVDVTEKGAKLKFHKEGLVLGGNMNPMDKLIMQLLGSISEFERGIIVERGKEGIRVAKSSGTKFGAANSSYDKKSASEKKRKASQERTKEQFLVLKKLIQSSKTPLTYTRLSCMLTEGKVRTPSGKEGKWYPQQVKNLMKIHNISLNK